MITMPQTQHPRPKLASSNLELYYGEKRALHGISLEMPERQVTALIGPSGCGKSTYLRCFNRMNDLIPGVRIIGSATIDETDLYGRHVDVVELRRRVGMDFQKSKGWIKASYILSNVNKRVGEPDLYLVTIADRPTTPAEDEERAKEINAHLQSSARQSDAQSGERAKDRKLGGNMLLQELVYRK